MISKRMECRSMKCTTELHGGVRHRTSTPHKSGNKMKNNKKNMHSKNECLCSIFVYTIISHKPIIIIVLICNQVH